MPNHILDRHHYNAKTIETFEIISAYFVDIFYNHLYLEAVKKKSTNQQSSITDGYKYALHAYLESLKNPKLYRKLIQGIHHYFIAIGFAGISYSNCIKRISCEFIPCNYQEKLTFADQSDVMRRVICQSNKKFISIIVQNHIPKIIDFHTDRDNVRILQDELIDCFILERESLFHRFIDGGNLQQGNINDNIDKKLQMRLQEELKLLISDKYANKKKFIIVQKILHEKNIEIKSLKKKLTEYIKALEKSRIQNNSHKEDIYDNGNNMLESSNYTDSSFVMHNSDKKCISNKQNKHDIHTQEQNTIRQEQDGIRQEQDTHNREQDITRQEKDDSRQNNVFNSSLDENNNFMDKQYQSDEIDSDNFIEINTSNLSNIVNASNDDLLKHRKQKNTKSDKLVNNRYNKSRLADLPILDGTTKSSLYDFE
jgi:hypothetical protein